MSYLLEDTKHFWSIVCNLASEQVRLAHAEIFCTLCSFRYSSMVGEINTVSFTLNGKVQVVNGELNIIENKSTSKIFQQEKTEMECLLLNTSERLLFSQVQRFLVAREDVGPVSSLFLSLRATLHEQLIR